MDRLRRNSFRELLGSDWKHGVEPAVDIALLGRYYERIADHAVSIARRVVFLVTGEHPQYACVTRDSAAPSWRSTTDVSHASGQEQGGVAELVPAVARPRPPRRTPPGRAGARDRLDEQQV